MKANTKNIMKSKCISLLKLKKDIYKIGTFSHMCIIFVINIIYRSLSSKIYLNYYHDKNKIL